MKVTGLIAVGLSIVAMAAVAKAQTVDSFHGLKFGVPLSTQMKSCDVHHVAPCWDKIDEDGVKFYKVQLAVEDQLFTGMNVDEVNGGVGDVDLMFDPKDFGTIKDAITNKFGRPSFESDTDVSCLWNLPDAKIFLFIDSHHQGVVSANTAVYFQHLKDQKAAETAKVQAAF